MEIHEVEQLLEKYYEGETTLHEEALLQEYFSKQEVPVSLKDEKAQFLLFSKIRDEEADEILDHNRFFSKIIHQEDANQAKRIRLFRLSVGIAASLVMILIGFAAGVLYEKETSATDEVVALRDEFVQMKKMLMFNQMNNASASERIMAVNTAQALPEADDQVLEALIFTMNSDTNPNVRLAAVEALHRFADNQMVIGALIKSLNAQENPMVQIAIIEVLVDYKEKTAIDELQRLLQKENLAQAVREQAEYGISLLMKI